MPNFALFLSISGLCHVFDVSSNNDESTRSEEMQRLRRTKKEKKENARKNEIQINMQIYETMSSIKSKCKLGYALVLPSIHMDISALISRHQIPSAIAFICLAPLRTDMKIVEWRNGRKKANFPWLKKKMKWMECLWHSV